MRQLMFVCLLAVTIHAGPAASVEKSESGTPKGVDFSVLPPDDKALRELEERHRTLTALAARECRAREDASRAGRHADPCIRRSLESRLERQDDPQLTAFHYAMPEGARYNSIRKEMEWQPAVKSRIAETRPLDWQLDGREPPKDGRPR